MQVWSVFCFATSSTSYTWMHLLPRPVCEVGQSCTQCFEKSKRKSWKHTMEAECMAYNHFLLRLILVFSLKLGVHRWRWSQPFLAIFMHLSPVWLREAHVRAKKIGVTEWRSETSFFRYVNQSYKKRLLNNYTKLLMMAMMILVKVGGREEG